MTMMKPISLAALAGLFFVSVASARMAAPPAVPLRVAVADLVVVGKVTGFADKTVKAELFKGDDREMSIAKVKVEEALLGKAAGKEVQVGYFAVAMPRRPSVQLKVDQEAIFLLKAH